MPRTTTVESSGCPPLRALTFDVLGLVKVLEAHGGQNGHTPKVLERWGDPDASKCVLSASILDWESDPLVGIARKSGSVEVISAINGNIQVHIPDLCQSTFSPEDDAIIGVHLLQKHKSESSSRSCTLLASTTKGHVRMESVKFGKTPAESVRDPSPTVWSVCESGNILCSKVSEDESHALFGGKGVEVNIWDLHECVKIWSAKSPPKDNLGIFTPTWFTCATFLSKDDHRKFVAGTNSHQVRLYDISAQRRPVISIDFRETSIKAVSEDIDGNTIYIGNGSGDLASYDIRTGKLLGCFIGKCSGSIRSIARHPELPVIASCGLDSYLRIWDIQSRQLLSAHLSAAQLARCHFLGLLGVGELQPKKRRRLEDEEESQGENWKEKPVKMEPTWSREEDSLFCDIMKDLRKCVILPELNPEYDYWKMEIWDFIAGMYNDRASAHNFRMRSALDILVHGESVKAQFATQRAVFLKQPLTTVVFDSHFRIEAPAPEVENTAEDYVEETHVKRKKVSKEHHGNKKVKSKRSSKRSRGEED